MYFILWGFIYLLLQITTYKLSPHVYRKKWPLSTYIVSILHQTVITPYLWLNGNIQACYIASIAYFSTDLFVNYKYFDKYLLVHHMLSLVLLYCGMSLPQKTMNISAGWLVIMEIGSSGLNITSVTNKFYNVRLVLYGCTRFIVICHVLYILATDHHKVTQRVCVISFPIILHNLHVFIKMLHRKK